MIRKTKITVTTSGSAGASTGSGVSDKPISGSPLGVYIDYGSAPATTDVTIAEKSASPALTLLTVSDANTDGWFYKSDFTSTDLMPFDDHIEVSVTGADDANTITVTVRWLDVTR